MSCLGGHERGCDNCLNLTAVDATQSDPAIRDFNLLSTGVQKNAVPVFEFCQIADDGRRQLLICNSDWYCASRWRVRRRLDITRQAEDIRRRKVAVDQRSLDLIVVYEVQTDPFGIRASPHCFRCLLRKHPWFVLVGLALLRELVRVPLDPIDCVTRGVAPFHFDNSIDAFFGSEEEINKSTICSDVLGLELPSARQELRGNAEQQEQGALVKFWYQCMDPMAKGNARIAAVEGVSTAGI